MKKIKEKKEKKEKKPKAKSKDDSTLAKILKLFKNSDETSGEIVVSGTDSISFEVRGNSSKKIRVCFVEQDPSQVPCDPGFEDELSHTFIPKIGPTSILKVSWKVSGVRTIKWSS